MIAALLSIGGLDGGAYVLVRSQPLPPWGAARPFLCVFQENVSSIEAKRAAKCNVLPSRSFHMVSIHSPFPHGGVSRRALSLRHRKAWVFSCSSPMDKEKELRSARVEARWVKFVWSGDADQPTVSRRHVASAVVFSKKISGVKLDDQVQRVFRGR